MSAKAVVLLALATSPHRPCGTGFFVSGPAQQTFLVTAGHVAALSPLVAICNPPEGDTHSMLLPPVWITHPKADIALLPLPTWPHLDLSAIPFASLHGSIYNNFPHPIYTLGPPSPSITDYAQKRFSPALRSGHLTTLSDAMGYFTAPGRNVELTPEAYLADLASAPGHSGSPIFDASLEDLPSAPLLVGILIGTLNALLSPRAIIVPSSVLQEAIYLAS
jgi:hypothetical protein